MDRTKRSICSFCSSMLSTNLNWVRQRSRFCPVAMCLVVGVADKVVGQKTQALLEGNQLSGEDEMILFLFCQKAPCALEISAYQRLKQRVLHNNAR